jgi:hypothetical protein
MKTTRLALLFLLSGALSWLSGCASEPAHSSSASSATLSSPPVSTPAPVTPVEKKAVLPPGSDKASLPFEGEGWKAMFDGQTLAGWKQTPFAGHGETELESNAIILNMGDPFTGINYTNEFPKMNYEVALDAMRVTGSDFFCGLTVPVGNTFCSLIVGGWGGSVVGISSLDGMDASENETTKFQNFERGRWYRIRLRVTPKKLEAWLDDKKIVNVDISEKKISLRPGDIEFSKPMGIAAWQTTAALREIRVREVDSPADAGK